MRIEIPIATDELFFDNEETVSDLMMLVFDTRSGLFTVGEMKRIDGSDIEVKPARSESLLCLVLRRDLRMFIRRSDWELIQPWLVWRGPTIILKDESTPNPKLMR